MCEVCVSTVWGVGWGNDEELYPATAEQVRKTSSQNDIKTT